MTNQMSTYAVYYSFYANIKNLFERLLKDCEKMQIKIKSFCTSKETVSKVKRQPSEWEKIIPNEATDKQFISNVYKIDNID